MPDTVKQPLTPNDARLSPKVLIANDWKDYELVDTGLGRKLERFGPYLFDRPDPQAIWPAATHNWRPNAAFLGADADEAGRWRVDRKTPDEWIMTWGDIQFMARPTPFRHMGVFPEQSVHWSFAAEAIRRAQRPIRVLNLFGYTGLASLACAAAGAQVTHIDASKKAIGWGRENQALSRLADKPIRWICEDTMRFLEREARRGSFYEGVIFDPPKHGYGPNNEIWRLEEDLPALLGAVRAVMSPEPLFAIATVYAVRASFLMLHQGLASAFGNLEGSVESGEMCLLETSGQRLLPTAIFARWLAKGG